MERNMNDFNFLFDFKLKAKQKPTIAADNFST